MDQHFNNNVFVNARLLARGNDVDRIPRSLFNDFIPSLFIAETQHNTIYNYNSLEYNVRQIDILPEKTKPNYMVKLTPDNYEKHLVKGSVVQIPISHPFIHHKIIETYGHDRILQLEYLGKSGNDQLNFKPIGCNTGYALNHAVACKAQKLLKYQYKMYVRLSEERIQRQIDRLRLLEWRVSLF